MDRKAMMRTFMLWANAVLALLSVGLVVANAWLFPAEWMRSLWFILVVFAFVMNFLTWWKAILPYSRSELERASKGWRANLNAHLVEKAIRKRFEDLKREQDDFP